MATPTNILSLIMGMSDFPPAFGDDRVVTPYKDTRSEAERLKEDKERAAFEREEMLAYYTGKSTLSRTAIEAEFVDVVSEKRRLNE